MSGQPSDYQPHWQPTTDWYRATGQSVQLRRSGQLVLQGTVDAAMPDGSGFWLAADGTSLRAYVLNDGELELWVGTPQCQDEPSGGRETREEL